MYRLLIFLLVFATACKEHASENNITQEQEDGTSGITDSATYLSYAIQGRWFRSNQMEPSVEIWSNKISYENGFLVLPFKIENNEMITFRPDNTSDTALVKLLNDTLFIQNKNEYVGPAVYMRHAFFIKE